MRSMSKFTSLGGFISLAVVICSLAFLAKLPGACADQNQTPNQDLDVAQEAMQDRARLNNSYSGFNQNNPLSTGYGMAPSGQAPSGSNPLMDSQMASYQKLTQFMSSPYFKSLMKLVSDPKILKMAVDLANHPGRKNLAIAETILFVFFIFLKAWANYKIESRRWFVSVLTRTSLWLFYLGMSTVGIPALIFGDTYIGLIKAIYSLI